MNQQEYDRQMDECAKDGMGGGETLGHMNIMEGKYAPIRKPMWCDNEEQKKYRVGQCCDNSFHLNKKIKGEVMCGRRWISGYGREKTNHYWVMKNGLVWDIQTYIIPHISNGTEMRIWGYSLYKGEDFMNRFRIKQVKRAFMVGDYVGFRD